MLKQLNKKRVQGITAGIGFAIITAVASTTTMAATLGPSKAEYNFTVENTHQGTATRTLTKENNKWKYKVEAKVGGVPYATQQSTFKVTGDKVVPSTASLTRNSLLGMRTHKLNFSSSGKQIKSSYLGRTKNFSAPKPAFDELSLEAQMRQDLLHGHFSGNYYKAKTDRAEKAPFKKAGSYKITVPAGTFHTVRVDRKDNNNVTSFWLAPNLDYLPIKVMENRNGKTTNMELTRFR